MLSLCSMHSTIVVDTSVIISALIGEKGPSREILRRCMLGSYHPLISNALFLEYEDVIGRKQILDYCPLNINEIRELLNAFYATCHWVPIYFLWRPNVRDEGDNFLIELAVAGNAHHIITNNIKDLAETELKFPNLKISTPIQMLRGE